jgi:hypothetical protein
MAYNCLYRGTGTLLINWLRGANEAQNYNLPWHAQYGDGKNDTVFRVKLVRAFVGSPFTTVSLYIFKHFQSILFGIHSFNIDTNSYSVVLNPGRNYSLKESDFMFLIGNHHSLDIQELISLVIYY